MFFRLIIILAIMATPVYAVSTSTLVKEGNDQFVKERYDSSLEKYDKALEKESESDIVNFNAGAAYYKKGDYRKSVEHFRKSLLSDSPGIKFVAYYNLGNALYKDGVTKENQDIDQAVSSLEEALSEYDKAHRIKEKNKDPDLDYNNEFVKRELERLKRKKQKQKQEQKQQNQKQDQQDKKKQDQEDQSKNQQNKQDQNKSRQKDSQQEQNKDNKASQNENQKSDAKPDERDQQANKSSSQQRVQDSRQSTGNKMNEDNKNTGSSQTTEPAGRPEDMDKKQAQMLLKAYEQNEEPKSLLKMYRPSQNGSSAYKDW